MNRSILIVICDFLLVSLLAFSTADINKIAGEGAGQKVVAAPPTNHVDSGRDLASVMKLALEDERGRRESLVGELARARESVSAQENQMQAMRRQLESKEQEVQAKSKLVATKEGELRAKQQEIQTRQEQAQKLEQAQKALQEQYAAAQTNIQNLSQKLQGTSVESVISKEKLAAMEAEARKQLDESTKLQQQLSDLAKSNQVAYTEKEKLANQLQVAEVEKRYATAEAARMNNEVAIERAEKARLADGLTLLAAKSGELAREVRLDHPIAPNSIFNEFLTNRVLAHFHAYRPALLGIDSTRDRDTEVVLVTDQTNTYAICHIQDTPMTLWHPGADWQQFTGNLSRAALAIGLRSFSFLADDPRIVIMPLSHADATALGCKIYSLSTDPFQFQDAVLIGAREGYYGECKFQIDPATPNYVKLDRSFLKGIFGKFNPSSGDLVFSKGGDLLGVMANSTYCLTLRGFSAAATLQCGADVHEQHVGPMLSQLYTLVEALPFRLQ